MPGKDRVLAPDQRVRQICFIARGELVAGLAADGRVLAWNATTGQQAPAVPTEAGTRLLSFAGDGQVFATGGVPSGPRLRRFGSEAPAREFPALAGEASRLVLSADGSTLALSSRDKAVRVLDVSTGRLRPAVRGGIGGTMAMALSPDGRTLVLADADTNLRAWSTREGELLRVMEDLPVSTFAAAFSPDGKTFVSAGVDRKVSFWDTRTWKLQRQMEGQPEMIAALALSPDGRFLVTGGFDDISSRNPVSILVRAAGSGAVVRRIPSPSAIVDAAFSPDGTCFATTNRGQGISIWDAG